MTSSSCHYDVIITSPRDQHSVQQIPAAETFDFFSISIFCNIMQQIFLGQNSNKIAPFKNLYRIQNVETCGFKMSKSAGQFLRFFFIENFYQNFNFSQFSDEITPIWCGFTLENFGKFFWHSKIKVFRYLRVLKLNLYPCQMLGDSPICGRFQQLEPYWLLLRL